MGQPAARAGDTTAHGGVIAAGAPTVFIGKMPAARIGDPHVCPMVTPGTPPVPHVGMPIAKGSTGVNICGMPAARMGDLAPCTGPPDSIIAGCPTVTIGETKPGGGGGSGGGSGSPSPAQVAAAFSASVAGAVPENEEPKDHFLDVTFKDSAGLPVSFGNYTLTYPDSRKEAGMLPPKIKRFGVEEGEYEISLKAITEARWSVQEARDDETVECLVKCVGVKDGTPAVLQIWMKNLNSPDRLVCTVDDLKVSDNALTYEWKPSFFSDSECAENLPEGFVAPSFFFRVEFGELKERSGVLTYRDYIEIELKDDEDEGISSAQYQIIFSTGETRKGQLDGNGFARVDNVPPGKCSISFPELENKNDEKK